ncbi:MAG: 50S ribosomal protein L19 [Planctomycetes bacterium]|nr:50S ribosomal protein L19 [Planctomycetota bacterium]
MNRQLTVEAVVASQLKDTRSLPPYSVGDTIDVHYKIIEGDKERVQVFQGVLIATKGRGVNTTITVRRIVANEGVERIFPLHSPRLARIDVIRRGDARRSKLYFLRDRTGKSRRLRDQRRGLKSLEAALAATDTAVATEAPAADAPKKGEGKKAKSKE